MNDKKLYGFIIDLKSTFTSLNFWGSIVAVGLLAITLPSRGCLLDRLFELMKGPSYHFMSDGGLPKFMVWMMPHTLLSVIIGKETEVLLNCLQFRLPRYMNRSSFWISHSFKTIIVCISYYFFMFIAIVGIALLTGNFMPGVSSQTGSMVHIDIDNTHLLIMLLSIRVCLPMCIILQVQSFCQIVSRDAFFGGVAFVLLVAVPAFVPEGFLSKLIWGNWLILSRSIYMKPENGIDDLTVFIGSFTSFLLIQGAGFCLFENKNWY